MAVEQRTFWFVFKLYRKASVPSSKNFREYKSNTSSLKIYSQKNVCYVFLLTGSLWQNFCVLLVQLSACATQAGVLNLLLCFYIKIILQKILGSFCHA